MLVVSRKEGQRVVLPSLGIAVQLLKTSGTSARLGIDAPRNIRVLREELIGEAEKILEQDHSLLGEEERHRLRGHLNSAAMALNLLYRMLDDGDTDKANSVILKVFAQLQAIESMVGEKKCGKLEANVSELACNDIRALIVEDNENECELFAAFLRSHGIQADTAMNGRKALEQLSNQGTAYDIVLIDMQMPELNGAETVARIRSQRRLDGIKVFAVSGSAREKFQIPIGKHGVDRWFKKPVESDELLARMFMDLQRQPVA